MSGCIVMNNEGKSHFSYQLSVISYQLSVISYQLSVPLGLARGLT
ncbi:hypothetical protein [Dapis sp. BLCC M172]